MVDATALTEVAKLGATAWASKELAGKLLGPTFEYLGGEIRNVAEKCNVNLTDVFLRARRKLDSNIERPGGVSARVLKDVLDQGAFCDEPMAAEYVAGVLASARTDDGKDDRGVAYLAVIRQLSTYQLRAHYVIYWSMKSLLKGQDLDVLVASDIPLMRLFLPVEFVQENCGFGGADGEHVLLMHVLNGLARHDLIDSTWWGGDDTVVQANEPEFEGAGYFVQPTPFGVELFLWAHSHADTAISDFLSQNVEILPIPDFPVRELPKSAPDRSEELSNEEAERLRQRREHEDFVRRTIDARLRS